MAQYPEISLELSVSDTLTDIVAERFDAGIRLGERIERDMIAVRVTDELPLVVAGSPGYFEQRGKPKTPDDLVGHRCVRIRFSSGTNVPWRFRVKRRDLEVHVEGRLGVNSVAVARQAAIEGLALVQTPPIFIAPAAVRRAVRFDRLAQAVRHGHSPLVSSDIIAVIM